MIVMKFGGSSVGGSEQIKNVAELVKSHIDENPVVVVSAVKGITDKLIELSEAAARGNGELILEAIQKKHNKILKELGLDKSLVQKNLDELSNLVDETKSRGINLKVLDKFQSFGERMSSKVVAAQLSKIGLKATAFDAFDLGFLTNSDFGNAEPLEETFANLDVNIKKLNVVPVITGFIGKTKEGEITTIGRGGSDYTAGIVGAAINASEIQIWTDVDGIMSADPKVIEDAKTLDHVSFAEASELAYFGAKVLHPKTILPAMDKNIPVRVLNTFNSEGKGTLILNKAVRDEQTVKAITQKKHISLINLQSSRMLGAHGFLSKLFEIFDKHEISVDVVSTSEVSVSLTINNSRNIGEVVKELEGIANVQILKNKAVICVVGEGMRHMPGVAGRTFAALGKNKVNLEMISQGASEINITFVVDDKDADNAVRVLHKEYYGV
jgi:aspartate kinase